MAVKLEMEEMQNQVASSCHGREMWRVSLLSAIGAEDARHCGCHVVRLFQCSVVRAHQPSPSTAMLRYFT
jgi:hypothetical protein